VRRFLGAVVALALAGCSSPQLVDCEPGRFVRLEDDQAWCVYPSRSGTCPSLLPVEHELSFGGRGCAAERVEPPPEGLCEAAGLCGGDAG